MNKRAKNRACEGAREHAWREQKIKEKWGGVSEKGEGVGRKGISVSFALLTPSLCSLSFAVPPSSVPSCTFLETPTTKASFHNVFEFSQTFTSVSITR